MFRTINETVSNLRSSLPRRGTGEFVESPAHKVSVMVGGQRKQEDLGGDPHPAWNLGGLLGVCPGGGFFPESNGVSCMGSKCLGTSPQVRGAEAEAGGGIRPPGKVHVRGD